MYVWYVCDAATNGLRDFVKNLGFVMCADLKAIQGKKRRRKRGAK